MQRTKKVMSNGLGILDFAIWLVNSFPSLGKENFGKYSCLGNFKNIGQIDSGHDEEAR